MDETPLAPCKATIRPRVTVGPAGTPRLLEEKVASLLASGDYVTVHLVGERGTGKTAALQHLLALFGDEPRLRICDEGMTPPPAGESAVTIVAVRSVDPELRRHAWFLAPWQDEDCLAYLQAVHPLTAANAFAAWEQAGPAHDLRRWPGLCRSTLDALATGQAGDVLGAWHIASLHHIPETLRATARSIALRTFLHGDPHDAADQPSLDAGTAQAIERQLLRSLTVRAQLAAEELLGIITGNREHELGRVYWHRSLVDAIGWRLRMEHKLGSEMYCMLHARRTRQRGLLFSILSMERPGFRPQPGPLASIGGAWLADADLHGIHFLGRMDGVDFTRANLSGALFDECDLTDSVLEDAHLEDARLVGVTAPHLRASGIRAKGLVADRLVLIDADLRNADLSQSRLRRATLRRSSLVNANLDGADLRVADLGRAVLDGASMRGARLDGAELSHTDLRLALLPDAVLTGARLRHCKMNGLHLPHLRAERADFRCADLSGTKMQQAHLCGASMREANLAGVNWDGADLRGADFRRCSFGTAIEGGFRASLRDCDLRGATLSRADFGSVDVRGCKLDAGQAEWLRQCGAVLDDQAGA